MFLQGRLLRKDWELGFFLRDSGLPRSRLLKVCRNERSDHVSAQCPTCKNEVDQGPLEPDEIRRLLRQDSLSFYCGLCDHAWTPSSQELANVECLLLNPLLQAL
jgi:hypothetical protein